MSLLELWDGLLDALGYSLAFFYDLIPNYGVAIILVTIAVKIVTLPLTIKQTRSMQGMQKIQPEIKRVQAKYKGDREKLNQELMKLYQEHGVNPLGGCLPLLLQMPILIGLFQLFSRCGGPLRDGRCPPELIGIGHLPAESALREAIVAGKAGFLTMHLGLTPIQAYGEGLLFSIPYFLILALMAFSAWFMQKQLTAGQTAAQPPQMQMVAKMMIFFLPLISLNFPIALSVYWTTNNIWTIGQQYLLLGKGGKGGWLARLPSPGGPARPAPAESSDSNPHPSKPPGKPKGSGARKGRKGRR